MALGQITATTCVSFPCVKWTEAVRRGELGAIIPGLGREGTALLQGFDVSPCPCMAADAVLF